MPNFRRNLAVKVETPGGDNPLLLSLVTNGPFYRGIAVSGAALVGRGGTPPYAYAIIAGSLPTGLSLNGITGEITGTPSVQGHYSFVAQVQDFAANVFNQSFSIDVRGQLFQVGPLPTDGEVGLAYSYQFVVRDASGTTLTSGYSITAGNLPPGLSMNSAGLITGTPTAPEGINYATLTVTDGTDTLTLAFTITIYTFLTLDFEESRDPPTGWGGGAGTWLPSMIRGQEWRAHLVVTGGRPPYSFTESLVNPFPSGINLVANYRRLLSGKTMDAASSFAHLLAVGVTDSLGSFLLVQRAFFIVDSQQGRITPQLNGVDLSTDGPLSWNMKEGAGVTITASNDGQTVEYEISATGGGGSGIFTINGISSDSSGNFQIVSDGSISIVENSNGELEISVVGGGSQAAIQFQDEGSNLGTPGTVVTFNAVGSTLTASRVGNVLTLTSTATANTGTVTSVAASGGTTGLTWTGSPITTSGTLTLGGTLAIANGGTGQVTAAAAFNALAPVTTKGDLIVGDGANSSTRLGVGVDGQIPQADSTQATGIKWLTSPFVPYSTINAVILSQSPTAYWRLTDASGAVVDAIGGQNLTAGAGWIYAQRSLVPTDPATLYAVVGLIGNCIATKTNYSPFPTPNTGDWSLSFCYSGDFSTTNQLTFFAVGRSPTVPPSTNLQASFLGLAGSGQMSTNWGNGAGPTAVTTSADFNLLRGFAIPIHYAVVVDGTAKTVSFYVNGRLKGSKTYTLAPSGGTAVDTSIGNFTGAVGAGGTMGEVAVWQRKLTTAEVLAQATAGGFL